MMCFEPCRLHPAGALLSAVKILRNSIIPLVIVLVSQGIQTWVLIAGGILLLVASGWGILSWYRFTYQIKDNELNVHSGIFVRKKTLIPRERIQVIDFNQGILQRLFGVVTVQIETAGGTEPEAVFTAVAKQDAENLRQTLLPAKPVEIEAETTGVATPKASKKISFSELIIFGITSTSGFGLVAAFFSGIFTLLHQIRWRPDLEQAYFMQIYEQIVASILFTLIFAIIVLLFLWLLAVIGIVIKYGRFTVTRAEDRLQIVYGLLERHQISIPVQRIQAVRFTEGLMRQPWGYGALKIESAGYALESGEKALLWPLLRRRELINFLQEFLPEFAYDIPLETLPTIARNRYIFRATLAMSPLALAGIPVAIFWLEWGWVTLLLLPLAVFSGWWQYQDAGWGCQQNMLAVRFRNLFVRTTVLVPRHCMQSLTIGHSPFQRRVDLVTFGLDLASMAYFELVDVSKQEGEDLMQWYTGKQSLVVDHPRINNQGDLE